MGFSGGIWVGWEDFIHIKIIQNHPQFTFLRVDNHIPNKSFLISFVYGSPDRSKRKLLWKGLQSMAPNNTIPWLIMGDFNAILSPADKKSPTSIGKRCDLFGNFVDSCDLQDLGFKGPPFTWQRGETLVRLDRALVNDAWMNTFPQSLVHHLTRIKSDHRLLLLTIEPDLNIPNGRPFRFLAGWTQHKEFNNFVKDKWEFKGNMYDSLYNFTDSGCVWFFGETEAKANERSR
ncbi:reverse transcriptase [Gossypium australe]|uniref:Reverse transcriptase n=1 Tax=Gossypium australe TaxID=47621 RepID=A0A5B6W3V1_9ROSI|nr:reverse transcriptase [Gossypium australe]